MTIDIQNNALNFGIPFWPAPSVTIRDVYSMYTEAFPVGLICGDLSTNATTW